MTRRNRRATDYRVMPRMPMLMIAADGRVYSPDGQYVLPRPRQLCRLLPRGERGFWSGIEGFFWERRPAWTKAMRVFHLGEIAARYFESEAAVARWDRQFSNFSVRPLFE